MLQWMLLVVPLAALLALVFAFKGLRGLWEGRYVAGFGAGTGAVVFAALGLAAALVGTNFYTYYGLSDENTIGLVQVEKLGSQRFKVVLSRPGGDRRTVEILGDAWQLDARVLKWRGVAGLLGLDPRYRLERLSGRYDDVLKERHAQRTVHDLGPEDRWDLWHLANRYPNWLPWIDAVYGSAVYAPMADGADYLVTLSHSGLLVRPRNQEASRAVGGWR